MGGCASAFLLLIVMSGLGTIGFPWWLSMISFIVIFGAIIALERYVERNAR